MFALQDFSTTILDGGHGPLIHPNVVPNSFWSRPIPPRLRVNVVFDAEMTDDNMRRIKYAFAVLGIELPDVTT